MEQQIPDKPNYISTPDYAYILDRDRRQCSLRDICERSGRIGFCSNRLDFDHHHPQCLGGDSSFANMRLLCEHENRGRPQLPTRYWEEANYWDGTFNWSLLRNIQALAGRDAILDSSIEGLLANRRDAMLKVITLMIGATGTGKALIAYHAMFAINQSVNAVGLGRPRVKHVLWLTTEQTLRDLTILELRNEAYDLGMVKTRPEVRRAANFADLIKGPNGAAITVACPQSLWKVGEEPRRTAAEMRDTLKHYDTIIFDEVDWATEQVEHIVDHASHALKFSLTASPAIMDGVDKTIRQKFMSRFVLIDQAAVADYQRAIILDGCLKRLSPKDDPTQIVIDDLIVPCAGHISHESLSKGSRHQIDKVAEVDHVTFLAAIKEAVVYADQLEQDMRNEAPDEWYSPHIMVRLSSINEIRALMKVLPQELRAMRDSGQLHGHGWEPTAVYQGSERDNPVADERDLSSKDKHNRYRHPFMRAKDYKGQVTVDIGAKRILLVCNIGIRGLNNWPTLLFVDTTTTVSVLLIIQAIGRLTRVPNHLLSWHNSLRLQRFLEAKVFIPQTLLTEEKRTALTQALQFIVNMEQQVSDAGFRVWHDLLDDDVIQLTPSVDLDFDAQPLTSSEELKIIDAIGALLPLSSGSDAAVAVVSDMFLGNKSKRAESFSKRFIENESFRHAKLGITSSSSAVKVVDCTACLRPKENYTQEELIRFVRYSPAHAANVTALIEAIQRSDVLIHGLLADVLRTQQMAYYREPSRTWQLQKSGDEQGLIPLLAGELLKEIGAYLNEDQRWKQISQAVNVAAMKVFGIDDAKNNGLMNQHPYHVAIVGRCRQQIKDVAKNLLAERGHWPNRQKCIEM